VKADQLEPGRRCHTSRGLSEPAMEVDIVLVRPLIALIAGILILLVPRLLNYVVALYLIFIGVIGLWPHFAHQLPY
jgi:hypothetical protein